MQYDLHNHSYYSDGEYSPTELVKLAKEEGIDVLALTDHDNVAGIAEALQAAEHAHIRLIPGVEISTSWMQKDIHIVGLGIDPEHPVLQAGLQTQLAKREQRSQGIGEKLAELGIADALAGAQALAGSKTIARPHFAHFLLKKGLVKDFQAAFSKYLGTGKPAYIAMEWASIPEAVQWIQAAGGQAVIAHPARYKLSRGKLFKLFDCFAEAGGDAIEVVTANHSKDEIQAMADYAKRYHFLASMGSDFHGPNIRRYSIGHLPPMPANCTPIWQDW